MAFLKGAFSSFRGRVIMSFVGLLVLASLLLYQITYVDMTKMTHREIISAQTEAAYADKQYLQQLFESVENRYYQLRSNSALTAILDHSAETERSVIYQYISEIRDLITDSKSGFDMIDDIIIYTSNEVAAAILPNWRIMDELDTSRFPRSYQENAIRALYQHFWCALPQDDGSFKLAYYAGLMDDSYLRLNGIASIICNDTILDSVFTDLADQDSIYIYLDEQLVFSVQGTPERDRLVAEKASVIESDVEIFQDNDTQLILRFICLPNQNMMICRVTPLSVIPQMPPSFWGHLFFMVCLATLLMLLFFHPLFNITALARHMQAANAIPLEPFPHTSNTTEMKAIISEYNAMVSRVNELSQTINQKELLLRNAQIERLQSQLNPHFFYGTLESIRMIAEINGQDTIAEIAYDFANMMHYSLSRDFFVPLSQEIDIVNQYIAIQKKRLGDRFTVSTSIDAVSEDWRCPKFVLFSLVENAFTHDVSNSRRTVNIQIVVSQQHDTLYLSVRNDGPGIEPERLRQIRRLMNHPDERQHFTSKHNGRTIFNINDRLRFYYGEDYGFEIDSIPGQYTICSIQINRNANFQGWEGEEDDHLTD